MKEPPPPPLLSLWLLCELNEARCEKPTIVQRISYAIERKLHICTLLFLEIAVNIFRLCCKFMVLHLCANPTVALGGCVPACTRQIAGYSSHPCPADCWTETAGCYVVLLSVIGSVAAGFCSIVAPLQQASVLAATDLSFRPCPLLTFPLGFWLYNVVHRFTFVNTMQGSTNPQP